MPNEVNREIISTLQQLLSASRIPSLALSEQRFSIEFKANGRTLYSRNTNSLNDLPAPFRRLLYLLLKNSWQGKAYHINRMVTPER